MNRRKFLLAGSGAALSGLAGCNGAKAVVRQGPPRFEEVELSGPESAEVGERFELEVSAVNTGGEPGDFTTTLTIGEGPFSVDESVKIEDVPLDTRKSTTVGPLRFGRATTFKFRITDYAAEHEVTIQPLQASFGDSMTLWNDLKITPKTIEYVENLFYNAQNTDPELITPGPTSIFAILHADVENTGGETVHLSTASLNTNLGSIWTELKNTYSIPNFQYITGAPYQGEFGPGESGDRWLLLSVSRDAVTGTFELSANRDGDDTPPEIVWSEPLGGPESLPKTTLTDFAAPDAAEIGSDFGVTATFENTGGTATHFNALLYRRNAGDPSSKQLIGRNVLQLDPGGTDTVGGTFSEPLLGDSIYWVEGFDHESRIGFEPASRTAGDMYTQPTGVVTTVSQLSMASRLVRGEGYYETVYEANSGNRFVVAHVEASNPTGEYQQAPSADEFSVVTPSGEYGAWSPNDYSYGDFTEPFSGSLYSNGAGMSLNGSASGWLVFEVPRSDSFSNVKIQWERQYEQGYTAVANWRPLNA